MKWFKHISESGDDPDIDDSITLFGVKGYYFFFRTLEIMSREFNVENPGVSDFTTHFFFSKFRLTRRSTVTLAKFFNKRKRILFELYEEDGIERIRLTCPKLKELSDKWTTEKIRRTGQSAAQ